MAKTRTLFLAVAGGLFALTAATSGFSQTAAPAAGEDALAETWERAQAQIETCKGLEGKMRYDLAARCYDDVAEMLTVAAGAKTGPAVVLSPTAPAAKPAQAVVATPPARPIDAVPPARAIEAAPAAKAVAAAPVVRRPAAPAVAAAKPKPRPVRVASRPSSEPRLMPETGPLPDWTTRVADRSAQRCSTLVCSRFVLIGVGF
jgi:hypothetical protein